MNTYEQQLTEILNPKGCGKIRIERVNYKNDSDGKDYIICDKDNLCPTCKAIQQSKKETLLICAKVWLKYAQKTQIVYYDETGKDHIWEYDLELIKELQEVIKKLEEMK